MLKPEVHVRVRSHFHKERWSYACLRLVKLPEQRRDGRWVLAEKSLPEIEQRKLIREQCQVKGTCLCQSVPWEWQTISVKMPHPKGRR